MDTEPLNIQTDSLDLEASSAALSPISIEPPTVQYNPMNSNVIDEIQRLAPIFDGKPDGPSWEHWMNTVENLIRDLLPHCPRATQFRMMTTLLHPDIKKALFSSRISDYEIFEKYMRSRYPKKLWARHFATALHNGTLFKGLDIHGAKARAKEAVVHLGEIDMWCAEVITALLAEFSDHLTLAPNYVWDTDTVNITTLEARLEDIEMEVLASQARAALLRNAPGCNHRCTPLAIAPTNLPQIVTPAPQATEQTTNANPPRATRKFNQLLKRIAELEARLPKPTRLGNE
ncbi:hypothetical protein H4R33_007084 [Dimargaris cristalligena]|nr:hypothetical protein H4R33_007084 [Dimargaris cristalligena]